jgi:hypothetical protein
MSRASRSRLTHLATAAALAALLFPADASAKPCHHARGQQTVLKTTRVRIFVVQTRLKEDPVKVYGCYGGIGLDFRIDRRHVDDAIGEIATSGSVVGFADTAAGATDASNDERLLSVDLRTGRRIHMTVSVSNRANVTSLVSAVVVNRNGSLAWIVTPNTVVLDYQVSKLDRSGPALLYAGNDISPTYLVLGGKLVGWSRNNGTFPSAPFS